MIRNNSSELSKSYYGLLTTLPEQLLFQKPVMRASVAKKYSVLKNSSVNTDLELRIHFDDSELTESSFSDNPKQWWNLTALKLWDLIIIGFTNSRTADQTIRLSKAGIYTLFGWQAGDLLKDAKPGPKLTQLNNQRIVKTADSKLQSACRFWINTSFVFTEKNTRGKFVQRELYPIEDIRIENNRFIAVKMNPKFYKRISRQPITQIPNAIFSLNANCGTAYILGKKMSEHYYQQRNQKIKTHNTLCVDVLCRNTPLDTIDASSMHGWRSRKTSPVIKFTNALSLLSDAHVIASWNYKADTDWTDFSDWKRSYIHYRMPYSCTISKTEEA